MQNFWYHSPVRFYSNTDDLVDTTNPQNLYNNLQPYPLELGVYHRYLLPNNNNAVSDTNLKLILVSQFSEIEIPCLFKIVDSKLQNVTFKHTSFASGYFEIRNSINEVLFTSNCVKFIDSSDFYGRKFVRVISKHTYDRFLFNYDDYMVTNLPAYNIGKFKIETDASNSRTGNNSSLRPKEAYHDEVTPYEFMANGDSNILGFLQTHVTNNEFYIDGTLRTSLNKLEADEFNAFGKIDFVNVKDSLGKNITIDENNVFADLELSLINSEPLDGDNYELEYDKPIVFYFNSAVFSTGNLTKKIKLYGGESGFESVIAELNFNQLIEVDGNKVTFLNAPTFPYDLGNYSITIPQGMFKNSLGFENQLYSIDFSISDSITPSVNITWEDDTIEDKIGLLNTIGVKVSNILLSANNPSTYQQFEKSTDGISYTSFIGNTLNITEGDNYVRYKVELQNLDIVYSNVLKYSKNGLPLTNYYFQATRPFNYPGNDYVRYLDAFGIERVEILTRSHWEDTNGDGELTDDEWIEAPCTLIQAYQILETQGAMSCTP